MEKLKIIYLRIPLNYFDFSDLPFEFDVHYSKHHFVLTTDSKFLKNLRI